jgi:hypothetical protein
VQAGSAAIVGLGVHPFRDPTLEDDFTRVALLADVLQPHTYSAVWHAGGVEFYIDDALVYETTQSPDYPLQLMLNIYEGESGGEYPKRFPIEYVRGYRAR